jgi:hypothetical protein
MSAPVPPKAGFLRSGGWWVVAAVVVSTVAFAFYAAQLVRGQASHGVGDRRDVATYGFTLEPCLVPRASLIASGMPKDGLPALANPSVWNLGQADAASATRAKFLVPNDRVIGLTIGGQARAYPLRLLVWHEVVNDTLGGVPIAVTYNALCDSAVVFRRTLNGRTLTFGVSGILYDSNLVMYDREPDHTRESLWSQLLFKAVTGPAAAAGANLAVLPISVETWADWRREHPESTVLAPDPRMARQYSRDPYTNYFGNDLLRFPVQPLPSPARYPLKTPVVAVGGEAGWTAFPFPLLASVTNVQQPLLSGPQGELARALAYRPRWRTVGVNVDALPAGSAVVYASYFAWYATHHADTTWAEAGQTP